jgi:DICT domain-containing protein
MDNIEFHKELVAVCHKHGKQIKTINENAYGVIIEYDSIDEQELLRQKNERLKQIDDIQRQWA